MASVTLAESAKLCQDLLLAGVIETIVTVNPIYEVFPFMEIDGNALAYDREVAVGDVQFYGVGGTITAKNPASFEQVTSALTRILGDAEVDNLIQDTRSNKNDQKAIQIASKAKSVGRQYQQSMITGDGTGDSFEGLMALVPDTRFLDTGTNGCNFSFELMDEMIDAVKDKDGQVDYFMFPSRTLRKYFSLLRALGGANISEVMTLPSGRTIPTYRGIPIFRNDYMPTNQTKGDASNTTTLFAGTFDDGSGKYGISGLTARNNSGIRVKDIGESHTKDESITRVKMYCGMALFSELGIVAADGVKD